MCGRFVASRPIDEIARLLEVDEIDPALDAAPARWNVAPQADVAAVSEPHLEPGRRRLSVYRWGLVPWWAKDPSIGTRAFNAKAETLTGKAMFRGAVLKQRCLIPVDAFYEWAPAAKSDPARRKQPWCFKAPGSGLLLLGGLWERWRPRNDESAVPLFTCTILTTEANDLVRPVHDRMPVLVAEADIAEWLAAEPLEQDELHRLTQPAPKDALEAFQISAKVNDAREDGPELIEPVGPSEQEPAGSGERAPQLF